MNPYHVLLPEFYMLSVVFLGFILVIIYQKIWRSSIFIFLLIIVTTFYTPVLYYVVVGGTAYTSFSLETLRLYTYIGAITLFVYSVILLLIKHTTITWPKRITIKEHGKQLLLRIFSGVVIVGITLYCMRHWSQFPLVNAITKGAIIKRPDTTGAIPFWFTVSSFIYIVYPCIYFYWMEKKKPNKLYKFLALCCLFLFTVLGGNKGIIVFLCIFIWVYQWKMKFDGRIILLGVLTIIVYFLIMGNRISSLDQLVTAIESPIRRMFVTQAAMFINSLEMQLKGFAFNFNQISAQVFEYVYGIPEGSAPTYFLGDLFIRFGLCVGYVLHLGVFMVFAILARVMDTKKVKLHQLWLFFMVQYLLGMSGIVRQNIYRIALIVAVALLFSVFDNDTNKVSRASQPSRGCQRLKLKKIE